MSTKMHEATVEDYSVAHGDIILTLDQDQVAIEGAAALEAAKLFDKRVNLNGMKAMWYIDLPIFEGERPITESHVQRLFDAMRDGTFLADSVTLVTAILGNRTYKINGQHTSWAAFYMTEKVDPKFSLNVREVQYRVKDQEQLRLLYSLWDVNKPRSSNHLTSVHLAGIKDLEGVPGGIRTKLISAYKLWKLGYSEANVSIERSRYTPAQIAAMIKSDGLDSVVACGEFIHEGGYMVRKHVCRSGPMAAMLETFSKTKTKAPEFWKPVMDGIGLDDARDARYCIREFLTAAGVHKDATHERASGKSKKTLTAEQMYRTCIRAWNYWRDGTLVQRLQTPPERPKAK